MSTKEVIKTFIARFAVDGSNLLKGYRLLGEATKKFKDKLSKALSLDNIKTVARGITGFIGGAIRGLTNMVTSFQDNILKFADFSEKTGMSVENASRLASALELVGGSADEALDTMESIQQAIVDASFGGGSLVEAAKKYGIQLFDNNGNLLKTEGILIAISKRMQVLNKAQQADLASSLGLGDAGTRLLQKGPGELLSKMNSASFVVSEKDAENARKIRESTVRIKQTFKAIGLDIQRLVIPFVAKALDFFKDVPEKFRKLFLDSKIARGITNILKPAFNWFSIQIRKMKNFLKDISLDKFMKSLPHFGDTVGNALSGAWDAVANTVENLFGFLKKQGPTIAKSVLNALKYAFESMEKHLPNLASKIGKVFGIILKKVFEFGKWLSEAISNSDSGSIIQGIKDLLSRIFKLIKNVFVNFFDSLLSTAFGEAWESFKQKIVNMGTDIKEFFTGWFSDDNSKSVMAPVVTPNMRNNNNVYNNSNNQRVNITVNGAKDPNATAAAIKAHLYAPKTAVLQSSGGYR